MRTFGVLFRKSGNDGHAAVARFTTQPTKKSSAQHRSIDPIRLGPSVFARYCHTGGVDDVSINAASAQPSGQPKAVPASFIPDRNPSDFLPALMASSRPRYKRRNKSSGSGAIFFSGSRLRPGIMPATSQLERLSSRTTTIVLS